MTESASQLSATKQALQAIQNLQKRINELEHSAHEPIAVVGLACHLPGDLDSPEQFWNALIDGKDLIIQIPEDRWNADEFYDPSFDQPGKMYTKFGAFLKHSDQFDATFFGISPREAHSMDPHQRLLLHTVWEAFDSGGFDLNQLYGKKVGVYVGISNFEYGAKLIWPEDQRKITAYSGTGGSLGVAAGRISYSFGFTGPSMIIDTACSSSLVTTHLAIQALRLGECDMAVSSGVNLIFGPETHINFCQAHMLAPDGHCKTFSDDADGYARGEGVGSLILKRLSDAERDGDKIYALLLGSAVNQDGPSGGLTVPNGPSQERVIQAALDNARIRPEEVSYIEAHGTGTSLGDPIEVSALTRVFSLNRSKKEKPLYLSSVKTNIGHLESAAGIAGLIKTILSVSKGMIPPHRNFKSPNPHIDWDAFPGHIPLKPISWNSPKRIGGVSSFSFSGTNAHVVVSNYEAPIPSSDETTRSANRKNQKTVKHQKSCILPLSGKTIQHLAATQANYLEALRNGLDLNWQDWCTSAARGRTHHSFRSTLIAASVDEAIAQLESGSVEISSKKVNTPRIAFQFTGQGSQYLGMGKDLYEENEVFRHHMDACDTICKPIIGQSLVSLLYDEASGQDSERIHATRYTQPVLFSFEYALARVIMDLGIEPEIMLGHSLGEYVAATLSGVFKLEDALKIVCERGRLMDERCPTGSMLSVSAAFASIQPILEKPEYSGSIELASVNTNTQVVLAGDHQAIAAFSELLTSLEIENKLLQVSHAFHSHLVEPMMADFERAFDSIEFGQASIPMLSNVHGNLIHSEKMRSPNYWCEHLRRPVQYHDSIQYVLNNQYDLVIEIGPKPILTALGQQISEQSNSKNSPRWIATQRKQTTSWDQILHLIALLYEMGLDDPLKRMSSGDRYPVDIPTQAFIKERYWLPEEVKTHGSQKRPGHPLLGEAIDSPALPNGTHLFLQQLSADELGFLAHHRVGGRIFLPAAAHTEILYAASKQILNEPVSLSDVLIMHPLILHEVGTTSIQTILRVVDESRAEVEIYSRSDEQSSWQLHTSASATIRAVKAPDRVDLAQVMASNPQEHIVANYYQASRALGIEHGETFMALRTLKTGLHSTYGTLELPSKALETQDATFTLHPILLDAAYQLASFALRDSEYPYLPMGAGEVCVYGRLPSKVHCVADSTEHDGTRHKTIYSFKLTLTDDQGNVLATIDQLRFQRASIRSNRPDKSDKKDWFYQLGWDQSFIATAQAPTIHYPEENSGNTQKSLNELSSSCGFYKDLFEAFDTQIEQAILASFSELGWNPEFGIQVPVDVLEKELGIKPEYKALFLRCLEMLSEAEYIRLEDHKIEVLKPIKIHRPASKEEMIARFPNAKPEISLLYRCLEGLSDVLTGSQDPIELLFPDDDVSDAAKLYQHSIGSRAINEVLASALADAISELPAHRTLRILEIGAGTGGTTTSVLPILPMDQTEYWYTDVSSHFLRLGATQFGEQYPFLQFGTLDIEENRSDIHQDTFDIIIAANVIHATRNIGQTLDHCYERLAPGGLLFLLEASPKQRWLDLTFGMTDGWWRFKGHDDRRDSYPLLDATTWKNCLSMASFKTSVVLGENQSVVRDSLQQQVIIAQKGPVEADNLRSVSWITHHQLSSKGSSVDSLSEDIRDVVFQYPSEIGTQDPFDDQFYYLEPLIRLVKSISESNVRTKPRLWVIAPGSIYTGKEKMPSVYWSLPGLIRTIRSEYPELKASLLDPGTGDDYIISSIVNQEIEADTAEDLIVYKDNKRYVQRLKTTLKDDELRDELITDPSATYLITGGFGRMGMLSAKYLTDRGAKNILLLGRSIPESPELLAEIQSLEEQGVRIIQKAGDVSDPDLLLRLFEESAYPPIRGIIHAAGTLSDATLNTVEKHHFDEVMRSKVKGTTLLHEASLDVELDFFIVYSSIGAVFGPVGQANYASANSYMDQLIHYRRGLGLPGLSINWGPWSGTGLAQRDQGQSTTSMMNIIQFIDPEEGYGAFERLLGSQGQVVAVPIDWSRATEYLSNMSLLSTFMTEPIENNEPISNTGDDLSQLQDLSKQDQIYGLVEMVRAQTAKVLGSSIDRIDPTIGFFDMGMDSLTSVELRNALQASTKLNLPTTLIFKYPTVVALAAYLADELFGASEQSIHSQTNGVEPERISHQVLGSDKDLSKMSDDELSSLIDDAFNDLIGGDS